MRRASFGSRRTEAASPVVGSAAAPDAIRFKPLSREEGLSSDTIYGVLSDAKGRLWLSGDAGLMRLDPDSLAVKTYHREHGLQGEDFDYNAYHRMRDGRLCFGGPEGFNLFDPPASRRMLTRHGSR